MLVASSYFLNDVLLRESGTAEVGKEFVFEYIVGGRAQWELWLTAAYEADALFVKVISDSSCDHIRYTPTDESERTVLAWMATFIANQQCLRRNRSEWTAAQEWCEPSDEAAQQAACLLGREAWVRPTLSPAWAEDFVLALGLTFDLQLAPPLSYDFEGEVEHAYRAIVRDLVAVEFDTSKLTTVPS